MKAKNQPIRRRLRPDNSNPLAADIYSTTREGKQVSHHCVIDATTGRVSCTCEHFKYRLAPQKPTVATGNLWCKHLIRHAANVLRKAEVSA